MRIIATVSRLRRAVLAVGVTCLLGTLNVGPALGVDPPGTGAAVGGTGIATDPSGPRTPEELGYTKEYADQKASFFAQKLSAGALANPTSAYLNGWAPYHQKTTYNCLPAVGQSILHFSFGGYNSPSVAGKQGTSAQEPNTITQGMHTTSIGTDDGYALAYVNGQFGTNGSSWRYVGRDFTTQSAFTSATIVEIASLRYAMYVRVTMDSASSFWDGLGSGQHATAAIGYGTNGALVTVDDPFTHLSGSSCVWAPYTASNDVSCLWSGMQMSTYYASKDVPRGGNQPTWT